MLNAMEPSTDKTLVFCAGSTEKNQQGLSQAVVSAITFDSKMALVSQKVLKEQSLQTCTSLRRFPGRNDLVVGCYQDIVILRFSQNLLSTLSRIKMVHTG